MELGWMVSPGSVVRGFFMIFPFARGRSDVSAPLFDPDVTSLVYETLFSFWNSHMPRTASKPLLPRKRPVQARSAATVDAMFDATIQVLLTHGARHLTTTRVAERAGVSVGTMYQYFPHKEALLHAVIERYLGEVADAVEDACEQAFGQPLEVASDALVSAYILAKSRDVEASRALYAASSELEVTDLVQKAFERFRAAAARLLASCPDAQFKDADQVAFALLAAVTGATRVAFENEAQLALLDDFRGRMTMMARAFLCSAATE